MKMLFENVHKIDDGIWKAVSAPSEMELFGSAKAKSGERTVLLVERPEYDPASERLCFERSDALILNLGTKSDTLIIRSKIDLMQSNSSNEVGWMHELLGQLGRGDKEFLGLVDSELRGEANQVAKRLLQKVRDLWPGDLKKGERNNFSNTPDNFWYVVVQPRVQELSITVRGRPSKFQPSSLELKDDRPGYTRFKLAKLTDLDDAFGIIAQSTRRR